MFTINHFNIYVTNICLHGIFELFCLDLITLGQAYEEFQQIGGSGTVLWFGATCQFRGTMVETLKLLILRGKNKVFKTKGL